MRNLHHPATEDITLAGIFYALSDNNRLNILNTLAIADAENCGMLVGEMAKSTLSHHLKVLREAGLTRTRIEGTRGVVSLRREDLEARFPGLLAQIIAACAREE